MIITKKEFQTLLFIKLIRYFGKVKANPHYYANFCISLLLALHCAVGRVHVCAVIKFNPIDRTDFILMWMI